jgi:hypothetical protein
MISVMPNHLMVMFSLFKLAQPEGRCLEFPRPIEGGKKCFVCRRPLAEVAPPGATALV